MALESAFEAEALLVNDAAAYLSGTIDPSVTGLDAPEGSLYTRLGGDVYQKDGPALTDWNPVVTAATIGDFMLYKERPADFSNFPVVYKGYALAKDTPTSSPLFFIERIEFTNPAPVVQQASNGLDQVWDDRTTLSYS